jgi:integrase/recombinase XerD
MNRNWLGEYQTYLRVEKGLAENSIAAYLRDLKKLSEFAGTRGKGLPQLGPEDVKGWIESLRRGGQSPRSIARAVAAARGFYRYLLGDRVIAADPTEHLDPPRSMKPLPHVLSRKEMESLLQAPEPDSAAGARDRAMLETLYASGLRVSELVNLTVTQMDFSLGIVTCMGKGRKERIVPVGGEAQKAVGKYLREYRPIYLKRKTSNYLFLSSRGTRMSRQAFWQILKKYALKAPSRLKQSMRRREFILSVFSHNLRLRGELIRFGW